MFADVSASYYEGRTCPLVRFGYNRDGKRGKPQVVYTVLSAAGGCPVAIQAYPGNTADPGPGAAVRVPAGRVLGAASAPRLAPLLFDDETLADDRRTRDPVAAAKPTARARHKKASRCTDDGAPLHRLDTLLGELATRGRNTCRVPADPSAPPLSLLTEPTPTQRRATNLIESFPVPGTSES